MTRRMRYEAPASQPPLNVVDVPSLVTRVTTSTPASKSPRAPAPAGVCANAGAAHASASTEVRIESLDIRITLPVETEHELTDVAARIVGIVQVGVRGRHAVALLVDQVQRGREHGVVIDRAEDVQQVDLEIEAGARREREALLE